MIDDVIEWDEDPIYGMPDTWDHMLHASEEVRFGFAYRGLAFCLVAWYEPWRTDGRTYGVTLWLRGVSSQSGLNPDEADPAIFGQDCPDECVFDWSAVPNEAGAVLDLLAELQADWVALEGIILTHAAQWFYALDAYWYGAQVA